MAFWLGYNRGNSNANCSWQKRYDKLRDHHAEGLRQSSKKISELQTQLSGAKKGQ